MPLNQDRSAFDPQFQLEDLNSRIVVVLERIAEAFKVALWEEGKQWQLSPLQIQILVFIHHHPLRMRTISYLAKEFNVSKPTISEAVRILEQKKIIERSYNEADARSHTVSLTPEGETIVIRSQHFATSILRQVTALPAVEKPGLYHSLLMLVQALQKSGLVSETRMCLNCPHLRIGQNIPEDYTCMLLGRPLAAKELRVDCMEYNT